MFNKEIYSVQSNTLMSNMILTQRRFLLLTLYRIVIMMAQKKIDKYNIING